MSKQLTIFDEMTNPLYAEIADLKRKIKMEESALKTLDPHDYEDRNEIYSCKQMIEKYEISIDTLEKQISEIHALSTALNSRTTNKHR
ncbi:MAG: hypothetical protein ACLRFM_03225 [Alphaproteobacteria bacterium]